MAAHPQRRAAGRWRIRDHSLDGRNLLRVAITCNSTFQGLGNTKPMLLTAATRLFVYAVPAIWLSTRPGFAIEQVWYLSIATTTLCAVLGLWLLRRELTIRLAPLGRKLSPEPMAAG
jgi:hypothetical protein